MLRRVQREHTHGETESSGEDDCATVNDNAVDFYCGTWYLIKDTCFWIWKTTDAVYLCLPAFLCRAAIICVCACMCICVCVCTVCVLSASMLFTVVLNLSGSGVSLFQKQHSHKLMWHFEPPPSLPASPPPPTNTHAPICLQLKGDSTSLVFFLHPSFHSYRVWTRVGLGG